MKIVKVAAPFVLYVVAMCAFLALVTIASERNMQAQLSSANYALPGVAQQ